ncbi:MAG: hypothetical protein IPK26_10525 [Planctomycetes bacterium]|nr:hypothetical protein [Planctomycetota bacterium]
MNTPRSFQFAFLIATLTAATPAQDPAKRAAKEPPVSTAEITIDANGMTLPAGEITANDLIDAAAKFLGRNILWSPQELGSVQTFALQRPLAVDAPGCEEVLCQLLATRYLVVIPLDEQKNLYEVVSLNGQRQRDIAATAVWRTADEVLRREGLKQVVICSVPLKHINAQVATNALRPFFGMFGGGNNSAAGLIIGNTGTDETVLLQGFADQVADAIRLLRDADKPLAERSPEAFQLQQAVKAASQQIAEMQAQVKRMQEQIAALHEQLAGKK